jgi:glycosyltransferase involved in cell wall biosynthesis
MLLEALRLLRDRAGWTAWLVGGPQNASEKRYFESLIDFCATSGIADRVRFPGHRSDVPALLNAADIFSQPNLAPEPFGISYIEAMSAGLPVVASSSGAAPEIIDASCGVLVPVGDCVSLSASLRGLIQDRERREQLGRAGRVRAAYLCDPAAQTVKIASLMEQLA